MAAAATSIAAIALVPAAGASPTAEPGITATKVLLGAVTTEGGRSAAITRGAAAYFAWVNARGGVSGRTFEYRVLDDGGDSAETVRATRQLVRSDRVFAVVNTAGAESVGAVRDYLNRSRMPQLFAASCARSVGSGATSFPWTIGFQPSCQAEGRVYGRYLAATTRNARIAVLFQDDAYGGELLDGLRRGIARTEARVVAAVGYDPTFPDVAPSIRGLRAARANVLAVFGAPGVALEAYTTARRSGWRPVVVNSAVSSSLVAGVHEQRRSAGVAGAIAFTFLMDPAGSRDDASMRLYRSIMSRYANGADSSDIGHVYGMAVAYEVAALVRRLGRNPTRVGLMAAARSITSPANPFLLRGIAVRTGARDGFPVEQGRLQRWTNGRWIAFGGIWSWEGR